MVGRLNPKEGDINFCLKSSTTIKAALCIMLKYTVISVTVKKKKKNYFGEPISIGSGCEIQSASSCSVKNNKSIQISVKCKHQWSL